MRGCARGDGQAWWQAKFHLETLFCVLRQSDDKVPGSGLWPEKHFGHVYGATMWTQDSDFKDLCGVQHIEKEKLITVSRWRRDKRETGGESRLLLPPTEPGVLHRPRPKP